MLHVGVHSCVDILHGQVRDLDIALLFDPRRPHEAAVSKKRLMKPKSNWNVRNVVAIWKKLRGFVMGRIVRLQTRALKKARQRRRTAWQARARHRGM